MKKPKMRKMKSSELGISKLEFDRWLSAQLKGGIKVMSLNTDPTNAFWATEGRMTREASAEIHGIVYVTGAKGD